MTIVKCENAQEFVIGGYTDPQRSRVGFGAKGHLPSPRGVHWVTPKLVGQVAFTEWTDEGQLRHPRFRGLRDDKEPRDVSREVPAWPPGRLGVALRADCWAGWRGRPDSGFR